MNIDNFKKTFDQVLQERNYARLMNLGLVAVMVPLAWYVVTLEPARVLVPPKLTTEAEVSADKADEEYLRHLALFYATLLGNTTPDQVDEVATLMEPYLAPSIRNAVIVGLQEDAANLKEHNISREFVVKNSYFEKETGKTFVYGNEYVSGSADKKEREEKTYEFEISINNFMPVIDDLAAYKGKPRTLEELENIQRREEREKERNRR
ncbi:TraE/TraK family type IV conjugative transfer system protein [Thalassospira sp. CH_XMU1420-2]|uniref:TraE/TraK family type IV conjugative transfer system protein n=1 Tax=Thalassospira sp. CH_XMU1420-2 TaxID=3107769 RepID=UPI003008959C